MKLVIDRSRWLRGEGDEDSFLLRPRDCRMCCLGFFGRALGAAEETINDHEAPYFARGVNWPEWVFTADRRGHTGDIRALMDINDDESLGESIRESRIAEIFARHGITVEFVNSVESP